MPRLTYIKDFLSATLSLDETTSLIQMEKEFKTGRNPSFLATFEQLSDLKMSSPFRKEIKAVILNFEKKVKDDLNKSSSDPFALINQRKEELFFLKYFLTRAEKRDEDEDLAHFVKIVQDKMHSIKGSPLNKIKTALAKKINAFSEEVFTPEKTKKRERPSPEDDSSLNEPDNKRFKPDVSDSPYSPLQGKYTTGKPNTPREENKNDSFTPVKAEALENVMGLQIPRLLDLNISIQFDRDFQEHLTEILLEGFWKCKLIASGDVVENQKGTDLLELVQQGAMGGALLPYIGHTCTGIAILSSAIKSGIQTIKGASIEKRAEKITTFMSDPFEIYQASHNFGCIISMIYQEQIRRMNAKGKKVFGNFIALQVFHYISTDFGKNGSFLRSMLNGTLDFFANPMKDLLREFIPSWIPKKDPQYLAPESAMLNAILFFEPAFNARTEVQLSKDLPENRGKKFYIEGILATSIRTQEQEIYYHPADSEPDTYGFLFLPKKYAEAKKGYTLDSKKSSEQQNKPCIIL